MREIQARLRRDDGWNLPEIAVVMLMLSIAAAFFATILPSVQRSIATQEERSQNNDAARLAVERLDREIRSGNVLYDPGAEFDPNYSLRIYTQSNAAARCVQWRIDGASRELQRRSWPATGTPPSTLAWTTVVDRVVNKDSSVHAFTLDPDASKSGRTVIVEILAAETDGESRPSRVKASITGRNTTFNYPVTACAATPLV